MTTSKRLDQAIKKLYIAFHNNKLHPECCKQCAVGTILDGKDFWKHLSDNHGSLNLNYVGKVHQSFGKTFNGYTPLELLTIETVFLKTCGYQLPLHYKNKRPKNPNNKDILFNGLCKTIEFLCKLDNIENIMDYSRLFEFVNNKPKYKLGEVIL